MTVLRSREILPSTPKTKPKTKPKTTPKSTRNDTMAHHIEPSTPNPNSSKEPPPRRSLRISQRSSDEPDLDASASAGARVQPESEGFGQDTDGACPLMSLRSGKRVAKRIAGDGMRQESGEGSENVITGENEKGKRKIGSDSSENVDERNALEQMERNDRYWRRRMNDYRETAMRTAAQFAHFNDNNEAEELAAPGGDLGDWPGPFSTAMKIIRDREKRSSQAGFTFSEEGNPEDVKWVPKNERGHCKVLVPSLAELSLKCLLDNVDHLTSLDIVPDALRNLMGKLLCDSRRLNVNFFRLLLQNSPLQICVSDCSWMNEDELMESFKGFDSRNLNVLQLDLCGRCLPDYVMFAILAESSNNFPVLHTVSLRGACRLSDGGVNALISSAPALTSINLSQCSLLTYSAIDAIANSLGSILSKLYLDDCQGIYPMHMLPALKKFENLEVLSVAGIESVYDEFIMEFVSVCGRNMKELILADCTYLTDYSVKAIAEKCPGLCSIDISKCNLTDAALGFLANGCLSIQRLRLRGCPFSDQSVAAFIETAGDCLEELSLNTVKKVGCQTALSIARRAGKLKRLDLSWCRHLTDNALGLIVDNCTSLRELKLFGCTQITDVFLDGHSNPEVKIIGLKLSPILEEIWKPNP